MTKKVKQVKIKLKDLGGYDRFKETDTPGFYGEDGKPIYLNSTFLAVPSRLVKEGTFFELPEDKRKELSKVLLKEAERMKCYYFMEIKESYWVNPDDMNDYYGYIIRGAQRDGQSLYIEYIQKEEK